MCNRAVVELIDVCAGYQNHCAVTKVNVHIVQGEIVALLGANGSGKTTVIKTALGLLTPRTGEVKLFGTPITKFHDWARIGYVPQRIGVGSGVPATVREVVTSGLLARHGRFGAITGALRRLSPAARRKDEQAVLTALAAVDLVDKAEHSVATLSGGQQQRVLIARALAGNPDLLVLDEPTVGVDAASQRVLSQALFKLLARGITVLIVTHEMGILTPLITRTVVMRHGEVIYDGPAQLDLHAHADLHPHADVGEHSLWGEQP